MYVCIYILCVCECVCRRTRKQWLWDILVVIDEMRVLLDKEAVWRVPGGGKGGRGGSAQVGDFAGDVEVALNKSFLTLIRSLLTLIRSLWTLFRSWVTWLAMLRWRWSCWVRSLGCSWRLVTLHSPTC
jgi:hypothetical protein